jgi:hypothetical protein
MLFAMLGVSSSDCYMLYVNYHMIEYDIICIVLFCIVLYWTCIVLYYVTFMYDILYVSTCNATSTFTLFVSFFLSFHHFNFTILE